MRRALGSGGTTRRKKASTARLVVVGDSCGLLAAHVQGPSRVALVTEVGLYPVLEGVAAAVVEDEDAVSVTGVVEREQ